MTNQISVRLVLPLLFWGGVNRGVIGSRDVANNNNSVLAVMWLFTRHELVISELDSHVIYKQMASYSRGRSRERVRLKELADKLREASGRVSLAFRGLTELPRHAFPRPEAVRILDLSHNSVTYP